jgi:hypothetical protein
MNIKKKYKEIRELAEYNTPETIRIFSMMFSLLTLFCFWNLFYKSFFIFFILFLLSNKYVFYYIRKKLNKERKEILKLKWG